MGDDDELEICVIPALVDDTGCSVGSHKFRKKYRGAVSLTQQDWLLERRYSPYQGRL